MKIQMIGIDHTMATLDKRELFSLSKTRIIEFLNILKKDKEILGTVALSTCNRTEIWISHTPFYKGNILESLCVFKNLDIVNYEKYFTLRADDIAIKHLFMLGSGLKSQILGEDQIITQIRNSVDIAREVKSLDTVLDVLFRNVITASKKIKTNINYKKASPSIVDSAIKKLEGLNVNLKDKKCLVIGNGEMGRLIAKTLVKNNIETYMTLREHHKGDIILPVGVSIINFSDRISKLQDFDIIFSSTSTNRYIIKYEDVCNFNFTKSMIFVDLAVPRDIDTRIYNIENVTGFNIDEFCMDSSEIETIQKNIENINSILDEYINTFNNWYLYKDLNIKVIEISRKIANDTIWRLGDKCTDDLKKEVEIATKKSVDKLMFLLRDNIDNKKFEDILGIMENIYLKEVL